MFAHGELWNLINMAGILPMENGWQVVIRADLVDETPQQPHGLNYAIILQDECHNRILGFDNAHAFDGAGVEDRWDHEHKANRVGQRFRYDFVSASELITDFFNRLECYCKLKGVAPNFISDENHE